MYCIKCGKPLPDEAIFCAYCGNSVPKGFFSEAEDDLSGSMKDSQEFKFESDPEFVWDVKGFPTGEKRKTDTASFDWEGLGELGRRENIFVPDFAKEEKAQKSKDLGFANFGFKGTETKSSKVQDLDLEDFSFKVGENQGPENKLEKDLEEKSKGGSKEKFSEDLEEKSKGGSKEKFSEELEEKAKVSFKEELEEKPKVSFKEELEEKAKVSFKEEPEEKTKVSFKEEPEEKTKEEPLGSVLFRKAPLTEKENPIDKFYTFSKKNEEFQKLLDKEYERLNGTERETGKEDEPSRFDTNKLNLDLLGEVFEENQRKGEISSPTVIVSKHEGLASQESFKPRFKEDGEEKENTPEAKKKLISDDFRKTMPVEFNVGDEIDRALELESAKDDLIKKRALEELWGPVGEVKESKSSGAVEEVKEKELLGPVGEVKESKLSESADKVKESKLSESADKVKEEEPLKEKPKKTQLSKRIEQWKSLDEEELDDPDDLRPKKSTVATEHEGDLDDQNSDSAGNIKGAEGLDSAGNIKGAEGLDGAGDIKGAEGLDSAGNKKGAEGLDSGKDIKAFEDLEGIEVSVSEGKEGSQATDSSAVESLAKDPSIDLDFLDYEEGEQEGSLGGKIVKVAVAVVVIAALSLTGIKFLAPEDSGAAAFVDKAINLITSPFQKAPGGEASSTNQGGQKGDESQANNLEGQGSEGSTGSQEGVSEGSATGASSTEGTSPRPGDLKEVVASQLPYNTNIQSIKADPGFGFKSGKDYSVQDLKTSAPILGNLWYTKEDGTQVLYDREVVKTIILFNSQWIDYVHTGDKKILSLLKEGSDMYNSTLGFSKVGKLRETFLSLTIGEIRVGGAGFYVWVKEEIEVTEKENTSVKKYQWIYYLEPVENQLKIVRCMQP